MTNTESVTDRPEAGAVDPQDREVVPSTIAKLLLFLVWWFSGIGVGTAFLSPSIIGSSITNIRT